MELFIMLLGLTLTTTMPAQASPPSQVEPLVTSRGAFFALSVADMDASARWYAEKLGLAIVMRQPVRDGAGVVVLDGGGLIVELVQHDSALPLAKAAPATKANYLVHGFFKGGVVVDDFDQTVARIKARGIEIAHGPFPARDGFRANIIVRDNAGNLIQFFGQRR